MSVACKTPHYWEDAKTHLSSADSTLAAIIDTYDGEILQARGDAFYTLARSIVGQQISVKAADSVWARVMQLAAHNRRATITPQIVRSSTENDLRGCGLSGQKVKYMRAVADYFSDAPDFTTMEDDEILASLKAINGVGQWTAEMFMIFHLLKPDILPLGDIGLLKGIGVHYGDGKNKVDKETAQEIAAPWAPYRSVATWFLWRALDPVPVAY